MAFSNTIDLEKLLAPIPGDSPVGQDIREDRSPTSEYYVIKDARNSARATERSAMFGGDDVDLITPWRTVAESAQKILSKTSKDLEVTSWYIEALLRIRTWAGLRDGVKLMRGLVDEYWDGLYPLPDEDGIETKVASLTGLSGDGGEGTLMSPIRNTPVTEEGAEGEFSLYQYQQARDADRIKKEDDAKTAKAKAERFETLGYSLADIEEAMLVTDTQWCLDLIATVEETIEDYKALNEKLREHCGNDAPPSGNITKLLDEVLRTVRHMYQDRLDALKASQVQASAEAEAGSESAVEGGRAEGNSVVMAVGPVSNREDALRSLEEAAKYFRSYEPHTPIAAGIERLVKWGRMPVAELMMELLPDDNSRNAFTALTGVMLDGTDTASYTPPPAAVKNSAPAKQSSASGEESVAPAAAPAADKPAW